MHQQERRQYVSVFAILVAVFLYSKMMGFSKTSVILVLAIFFQLVNCRHTCVGVIYINHPLFFMLALVYSQKEVETLCTHIVVHLVHLLGFPYH